MPSTKLTVRQLKDFLAKIEEKSAEGEEALVVIMRRSGKSRFVDRTDFRFHPRTDKLPETQVLVLYESDH